MIGIKSIASYIPENGIDNYEQGQRFHETREFIDKKIGAARLPRKASNQDTSDLAELAVARLFKQNPELARTRIDALVLVTQNPDKEGLPHTSAILQHKLNLPPPLAAFDVSLGCSGYVYGLYILKGFLEASGYKNGLLVTSDPYSKVLDPEDRVTSLLFGDAATATWLGDNPIWELKSVVYGTDGSRSDYLKVENNRLIMNGRQIFNFAALEVAPHIKEALNRENLSAEDIDLYCLHQGSAAIIDTISKRYANISDRFMKDMATTGNTVSSSIPLLLEKTINAQAITRILISGFGVGLSIATAIIAKASED